MARMARFLIKRLYSLSRCWPTAAPLKSDEPEEEEDEVWPVSSEEKRSSCRRMAADGAVSITKESSVSY